MGKHYLAGAALGSFTTAAAMACGVKLTAGSAFLLGALFLFAAAIYRIIVR